MNNNLVKPQVTVIIPTYNHAKYLGNALQSVFDQTFSNWEIIIIDNNSTDSTNIVLESFKDSRLRTLQVNNMGCIATSRNIGIHNARGEWIAFLDSDDYWSPSKLKECLNVSDGVDLIYHEMLCYQFTEKPSVCGKLGSRNITSNPLEILKKHGPSLTTSAIIVKKNLVDQVGGFDEDLRLVGGEDFDLWLRLAKCNCKFRMIEKYLGYYLIGGGMHVTTAKRSVSLIDYLSLKHFSGPIKNRPNWMHKSMLASYLKMNSHKDFYRYLWLMLRQVSLVNNLISLSLILRTFILKKIFNIVTIA
jgi:glycosyltransferase involved in cell wall biosynthesis